MAANSPLEENYKQVQQFMRSPRSDLRCEAAKILSQFTRDPQSHPYFTRLNIGRDLLRLISDSNSETCQHSLISLINLTANPNFVLNFLKIEPFNTIIQEIRSENNPHIDLLLKLLVNSTRTTEGQFILLQEKSELRGLNVIRLIHLLANVDISDGNSVSKYAYLSYVLCNVTQSLFGRHLIIDPQRNLLHRYVLPLLNNDIDYINLSMQQSQSQSQIQSESDTISLGEKYKIFICGIWDTIRNCCFALNESPSQFIFKSQSQTQTQTSVECKSQSSDSTANAISQYLKNIFCADENRFIYEILNPLLGASQTYRPQLRNVLPTRLKLHYMKLTKSRFSDENIRKISLDCLHMIAGVSDKHLLLTNIVKPILIDSLQLSKVLKAFESWESSDKLITISEQIRKLLRHQSTLLSKDNTESSTQNTDTTEETTTKPSIESITKEENKEKPDDDTHSTAEDADNNGIAIAPMTQEYHHVSNKQDSKQWGLDESNAIVDWILDTSTVNAAVATDDKSTEETNDNSGKEENKIDESCS